jgi:hypothetical protein
MQTTTLPDLTASALFTPWQDPHSGITSYILDRRVATIQQSFYFVNPCVTDDGRYAWFYASFPPGGDAYSGRVLGVADLRAETVHWFPETQFRDASPYLDTATGMVYWNWRYAIYRRAPDPTAETEFVNAIPEEIHRMRPGARVATHLTRSADGREFFIDAHFGDEWIVGSLPVDGSDFELWQTFDRCYNHAQFSPTDPDLALIAQDYWNDLKTGERTAYDNRMWLIRRGEEARPIFEGPSRVGHEWWDADGAHVWYVNYGAGTERVNIHTSAAAMIAPGLTWHSHVTRDGRYLVGDVGFRQWAEGGCYVTFYNTETGRETRIISALPVPPFDPPLYHIHPHPQFVAGDQWVAYTTTALGRVDLALTRTADLIAATS